MWSKTPKLLRFVCGYKSREKIVVKRFDVVRWQNLYICRTCVAGQRYAGETPV